MLLLLYSYQNRNCYQVLFVRESVITRTLVSSPDSHALVVWGRDYSYSYPARAHASVATACLCYQGHYASLSCMLGKQYHSDSAFDQQGRKPAIRQTLFYSSLFYFPSNKSSAVAGLGRGWSTGGTPGLSFESVSSRFPIESVCQHDKSLTVW